MNRIYRRDFIKGVMGVVGVSFLRGLSFAEVMSEGNYRIAIDGEDFSIGHRVRGGEQFPVPKPSKKCDFVIIGGGVSGLTAAYELRDANFLLIEKEKKVGGHARRNSWEGIYCSEGAAYFAEPEGEIEDFYGEVGLPLKEVPKPVDSIFAGKKLVLDIWDEGLKKLPYGDKAIKGFMKFKNDLENLDPFPALPVEKTDPESLKLDRISFADYLKPYGTELVKFMNLYCRSALGGPVDQVSAHWGLNFYSGEIIPIYTLPGGTATLAEILNKKINQAGEGRIITGATVVNIESKGEKEVWVTYVKDGNAETVSANCAIVAIFKHFAKRIVKGLPSEQSAAMWNMKYQPYLVVNILLNGVPYRKSYDTWLKDAVFTDFIIADWIEGDTQRSKSVLTVYHPLDIGKRYLLLEDEQIKILVRGIVNDLERLVPGISEKIEEVRAFRWGHPMILSSVGALTKIRPYATKPLGNILFAHSDSQMAAAVECAIWEGKKNAGIARKVVAHG